MTATFSSPVGLLGWPLGEWAGLWMGDGGSNTIRFINFRRGNNVTLVAGSPLGAYNISDGIGTDARLMYPHYLAWASLFTPLVITPETFPKMNTVDDLGALLE